MYLLLEGEVGLLRGKRSIDVVKPGEIFGEIAALRSSRAARRRSHARAA